MTVRITLAISSTLIFGAIVVFLLSPSELELAAMKARQGQYQDARAAYEMLLADRGRTRAVVLPLSDIYIGMGDEDAADELFHTYLDEHRNDDIVLRRYADFLRDMQRRTERIAVLEEFAKITGDMFAWRELELLYDLEDMPEKRAEALLALAEKDAATPAELTTLARLQAARGDFNGALEISMRATKNRPRNFTAESVRFQVALALKVNRRDIAEEAVAFWNASHDNVAELLSFSEDLSAMGAPEMALRLLEMSRPYASGDAAVRLEALRLGAVAGDPDKSFESLLAWHADGNLPVEGFGLLVDLGIERGRNDETLSVLANVRLASLPLNAELGIIELASEGEHNDLFNDWIDEAGTDWRGLPSITSAALAVAVGDHVNAAILARRTLAEAITDYERAYAVRALANTGLRQEAGEVITRLSGRLSRGELAADALSPLAEAALMLGQNEIAVAAARRNAANAITPYSQALYARALTATGRPREALRLLEGYDVENPAIESASVSALLASGERDRLQILLYRRLVDPNLSNHRRTVLLEALVDSAPFRSGAASLEHVLADDLNAKRLSVSERRLRVRALALISPRTAAAFAGVLAGSSNVNDVILYATLLKQGGSDLDAYRVLESAAKSAGTTDLKDAFVETLISLGGMEAALPLLANLAEADGGDWRLAYEDALRLLDHREELAAALVRRAQEPTTTRDEKRDIAYALLEIGYRDAGERILRLLASGTNLNLAVSEAANG